MLAHLYFFSSSLLTMIPQHRPLIYWHQRMKPSQHSSSNHSTTPLTPEVTVRAALICWTVVCAAEPSTTEGKKKEERTEEQSLQTGPELPSELISKRAKECC